MADVRTHVVANVLGRKKAYRDLDSDRALAILGDRDKASLFTKEDATAEAEACNRRVTLGFGRGVYRAEAA